ncbi:MAG TPA: MFS transporter [Hyphomicrobiaceae bacterium]|jgi:predicted MFS family arabinose efflux permease|nr:MFS transporter [Hyphomicrobiaceae bacterium]
MNSATTTDPKAPPTRAILFLALASFVGAANLRVCDALLPQIAAELGVSVGTAAMMVTAFAVAYGVCQIVVGPLGDARGKLLMVALGSLWAGMATIVCAAMPALAPLVLFRFLAGAGAAAVIPLAIAWIGDVVAYERRQALLARYISGQILGIVFGQAAGGIFGELIGWRATLLMLGIGHLGAGLLILKERWQLSIGVTLPRKPRWAQAAFEAYRVLRQPWVRVVLISVFIEGLAMFGALAYVGADLHHRFGLGLGTVGALLASFGAGALAFAAGASWLVPRLGQPGLAAAGALLLAAGYGSLVVMPWLWLAVPAIAGIGLGFYMLHNTLQVNATQMAPEARGLAVSLFAFFLFTGQSLGVALGAPVVDRFGARPVFAIAAVVLVVIAFWFRARLIKQIAAS